jgi:hypothetical protein
MEDIEKEMFHQINMKTTQWNDKQCMVDIATACYEIHMREMIKILEEIIHNDGLSVYLEEKLKKLKG